MRSYKGRTRRLYGVSTRRIFPCVSYPYIAIYMDAHISLPTQCLGNILFNHLQGRVRNSVDFTCVSWRVETARVRWADDPYNHHHSKNNNVVHLRFILTGCVMWLAMVNKLHSRRVFLIFITLKGISQYQRYWLNRLYFLLCELLMFSVLWSRGQHSLHFWFGYVHPSCQHVCWRPYTEYVLPKTPMTLAAVGIPTAPLSSVDRSR